MDSTVSRLVAFLAEAVNAVVVIDSDKDGKVQGIEILTFIQKLAIAGFRSFQGFNLEQFKSELKLVMADPVTRSQLISEFGAKFDLPNDAVEFLIEDTLAYLDMGAGLVARWKKVIKNEVVLN